MLHVGKAYSLNRCGTSQGLGSLVGFDGLEKIIVQLLKSNDLISACAFPDAILSEPPLLKLPNYYGYRQRIRSSVMGYFSAVKS